MGRRLDIRSCTCAHSILFARQPGRDYRRLADAMADDPTLNGLATSAQLEARNGSAQLGSLVAVGTEEALAHRDGSVVLLGDLCPRWRRCAGDRRRRAATGSPARNGRRSAATAAQGDRREVAEPSHEIAMKPFDRRQRAGGVARLRGPAARTGSWRRRPCSSRRGLGGRWRHARSARGVRPAGLVSMPARATPSAR
jgi:hypothetical protein